MRKAIAIALLALASIAAFANRGNGGAVRGAAARAGMMAHYDSQTLGYVSDGLISLWDGISNAGVGIHDSTTATWKNLISGGNNLVTYDISASTWNEDNLYFNGTMTANNRWRCAYVNNIVTVELVLMTYGYVSRPILTNGNRWSGNVYMVAYGSSGLQLGIGTAYTSYKHNKVQSLSLDINNSTLYVQGTPVSVISYSDPWDLWGDFSVFGWNYSGQSMRGNMYCIRIYNRALTAAEIAHNYSVDKRRFNLP